MSTPSIDELLAGHSETVAATLRAAVELVRSVAPDEPESVYLGANAVLFGPYGRLCYVAPYTAHVNLGFYRGTSLADPHGLLEGTGKNLRHVKLRSVEDVTRPGVRALVEAAVKEYRRG